MKANMIYKMYDIQDADLSEWEEKRKYIQIYDIIY